MTLAMVEVNDALRAAQAADAEVATCLKAGQCLLLEAGAGAGKTYSLVEALRFLIAEKGDDLSKSGQRIACITYTNAATAVIGQRIDGNPLVYIDTIHAFFWSLMKSFQSSLRKEVAKLEDWSERLKEAGGIIGQHVEYDLGYRRIDSETITLHHDDVLDLAAALLPLTKFQSVLRSKFPYVLIDEYQDTNKHVMSAMTAHLLQPGMAPLLGLFGDHWQRIYDHTCGRVTSPALKEIGKKSNFRSAVAVVDVLNRMRPELPQGVKDKSVDGAAIAFHTNGWKGTRRDGKGGGHWKGDLPEDIAHKCLEGVISKLKGEGWDFAPKKTKILMLTHGVLAKKQGYSALVQVFGRYNEQWLKKQNDYIAFFADKLEPACAAYNNRRYGEMFAILEGRTPRVQLHAAKAKWSAMMKEIFALRETGSIGAVVDFLRKQDLITLPESVIRQEDALAAWPSHNSEPMPDRIKRSMDLRAVPYQQMVAVSRFIDGHTPFATQHSVKGDEFENVLVVVGRGWNEYNFGQYLELAADPSKVPSDKLAMFERNRNLFYVACSRPTSRLAVLFTQELSDRALTTLNSWFGKHAVNDFAP